MMTFNRGLAVGVVLAGAAVGLASPASAELLDGNYQANWAETGASATVVFTSCGAGCEHAEYPGTTYASRDYHLQGNTWTANFPELHQVSTLDNNTLAGVDTSEVQGRPSVIHVQLVKAG